MYKEYYKSSEYDVVLYEKDNKTIIEREDAQTKELLQIIFRNFEQARNFLKSKKYEIYRLTYE